MKRISLTLCLAFLTVLFCQAQVAPLKFNKNGEFKIVQFTDIHFQYHNPTSAIALKRINEVLDAERPDLIVFTGDVVYAPPADTAMRAVLDCASSRKIPIIPKYYFCYSHYYPFYWQHVGKKRIRSKQFVIR